jgi:glycosyltransferase involved in cell wall biosynthesis
VFNGADVITTPTPIAADLIRGRGLEPRIEAISCGIDLDRFQAKASAGPGRPASVGDLPDRPTLLFVGRLDDEKHLHELVGALPMVRRTQDAQVVLAGTGSQQGHLADLADRLGVAEHVHFLGFVPDSELPDVYRASDVFVMPGVAELQSLVTLEAMASGMPVIAADAMALPHLVQPGVNGYLYPPGDTPELATHAESLLASPADRVRMGSASRQMVGRHDITATLERFESLYDELSGAPVSGSGAAHTWRAPHPAAAEPGV